MELYTIRAGEHYSDKRRPVLSLFKKEFRATLRFDQSIYYQLGTNITDINKLWGFREGFNDKNSARLGWNCIDGKAYIYPYVHSNGVNLGAKDPEAICEIKPGIDYNCAIKIKGDNYYFIVNGWTALVPRGKGCFIKFKQFPYFGGDEVAPHDIHVWIKTSK